MTEDSRGALLDLRPWRLSTQGTRVFALTAFQPVDDCLRLLGEVIAEQARGARMDPVVTICRQVIADLSVRAPLAPPPPGQAHATSLRGGRPSEGSAPGAQLDARSKRCRLALLLSWLCTAWFKNGDLCWG